MTTALVAGSLLTILFAIVMILVASKVLRNNRARSAARIAALRALVAGPAGLTGAHVPSAPEPFAELADENDWDLALGEVHSSEFKVQSSNSEVQTPGFVTASTGTSET